MANHTTLPNDGFFTRQEIDRLIHALNVGAVALRESAEAALHGAGVFPASRGALTEYADDFKRYAAEMDVLHEKLHDADVVGAWAEIAEGGRFRAAATDG